MDRLDAYLDKLDPDDSDYGYPDDMWRAEACENPRRRCTITTTHDYDHETEACKLLEAMKRKYPIGTRLIGRFNDEWHLLRVDTIARGKFYVYWFDADAHNEWRYGTLNLFADVTAAPVWATWTREPDSDDCAWIEAMRVEQTHPQVDVEFVRASYRGTR